MTALVNVETVAFSPDARDDAGTATVTFRVRSGFVRDVSFTVPVTVPLSGVGDVGVIARAKLAFHRLSRRLSEQTSDWDDPNVGEHDDQDLSSIAGLQLVSE